MHFRSFADFELQPFHPHLDYLPGLQLLYYLGEDVSTTSVPTVRGRYHDLDLLVTHEGDSVTGFQFWLTYDPHRLLPAPQ